MSKPSIPDILTRVAVLHIESIYPDMILVGDVFHEMFKYLTGGSDSPIRYKRDSEGLWLMYKPYGKEGRVKITKDFVRDTIFSYEINHKGYTVVHSLAGSAKLDNVEGILSSYKADALLRTTILKDNLPVPVLHLVRFRDRVLVDEVNKFDPENVLL